MKFLVAYSSDTPSEDNASDELKAVKMSFCRKHDVELKEKLLDKIIPNDRENCNNWLGNGNEDQDGILEAKISTNEFAGEISLMETRMGSSKARTTTSSENGPFIGPAVSWEEMMMQLQFFGKWNKEDVRQLGVNDLVWIVD